MLSRTQKLHEIISIFSYFSSTIKIQNQVGLNDDNKIAEPIFIELLNKIYGFSLRDLNNERSNHAAIDAADDQLGIAVQITSNRTKKKKDETFEKLEAHGLNQKYKHIIFLLLSDADKSALYEKEGYQVQIITFSTLVKAINECDHQKFEALYNFCTNELCTRTFIQNQGIAFGLTQYRIVSLNEDISNFIQYSRYFLGDEPTQEDVKQGLIVLNQTLQQLTQNCRLVIFKILNFTIQHYRLDSDYPIMIPIANLRADFNEQAPVSIDTITEALENINLVYAYKEGHIRIPTPYYSAYFEYEGIEDYNFFMGICLFFKHQPYYDQNLLAKVIMDCDFSIFN